MSLLSIKSWKALYEQWNADRKDPAQFDKLLKYRYLVVAIGVSHTFLCAGIVFGWSSLESILIKEGLFLNDKSLYTVVFTAGAIGNYVSNLPCGAMLDRFGPRVTGIVGGIGFGTGIYLCSLASISATALTMGYCLIGFFGPCCQLPTLHLSCLFPQYSALVMSLQAAAFDGGSLIFFISKVLYKKGLKLNIFFYIYLIVPIYIVIVAMFLWPDMTMDNNEKTEELDLGLEKPKLIREESQTLLEQKTIEIEELIPIEKCKVFGFSVEVKNFHGASLKQILRSKPFWFLAIFTSIHILKLNFVVDTVDEQMLYLLPDHAQSLIFSFGWMLPLGFVIMPFTSFLLARYPIGAFQLANVLGIIYCISITIPSQGVQYYLTFPLVAISRQLVYSIVFHSIAELFGFIHFGVLLGTINLMVGLLGCLQYPIVKAAESASSFTDTYYIMSLLSVPLFIVPFFIMFRKHENEVEKNEEDNNNNVEVGVISSPLHLLPSSDPDSSISSLPEYGTSTSEDIIPTSLLQQQQPNDVTIEFFSDLCEDTVNSNDELSGSESNL